MADNINYLGRFLRAARDQRGLSLRSVEEATGISNAYLSQLEHGRIRQPSPVVLYRLTEQYGVSYSEAMHHAGYPVPGSHGWETKESAERPLARFENVTREEEQALAEYLEFIRARRRRRSR
jgi:transcriptional regulator with XRE-family HTH domain